MKYSESVFEFVVAGLECDWFLAESSHWSFMLTTVALLDRRYRHIPFRETIMLSGTIYSGVGAYGWLLLCDSRAWLAQNHSFTNINLTFLYNNGVSLVFVMI